MTLIQMVRQPPIVVCLNHRSWVLTLHRYLMNICVQTIRRIESIDSPCIRSWHMSDRNKLQVTAVIGKFGDKIVPWLLPSSD